MRTDIYIALIAVFLFFCGNVAGGLLNDHLGYYPGTNQIMSSLVLIVTFCSLQYLLARTDISLRKSLRLPVLRAIFWIIISWPLLDESYQPFHEADFIDAIIPSFCFLASTIALETNEITWLRETRFGLWGIYILGVTIYQIVVLELSELIFKSFQRTIK